MMTGKLTEELEVKNEEIIALKDRAIEYMEAELIY